MEKYSLKTFVDKISTFASKNGFDHLRVMEDLLDYIIGQLSYQPRKIPGWNYSREQNEFFWKTMLEYIALSGEQMNKSGWYDAWGDLFMELKGNSAGYRNQFFTPPCVAALVSKMSEINTKSPCKNFGYKSIIGDVTCGSGRMLLAAHVEYVNQNKDFPYLIGEDIDYICCKMTAVNMAIHGCYGEVICHDSLNQPKSLNAGYIINEGMYPFREGIPTIRCTTNPSDFVFNFSTL